MRCAFVDLEANIGNVSLNHDRLDLSLPSRLRALA
jgi:hypothetical protein